MELHFSQWHTGLTKQAISAQQHLLKSLMGPAKLLWLAFVCESDHLSAVQPLLSAFVGISISSDLFFCVFVCVSLRMCQCVRPCCVCVCVKESAPVFLNVLLHAWRCCILHNFKQDCWITAAKQLLKERRFTKKTPWPRYSPQTKHYLSQFNIMNYYLVLSFILRWCPQQHDAVKKELERWGYFRISPSTVGEHCRTGSPSCIFL